MITCFRIFRPYSSSPFRPLSKKSDKCISAESCMEIVSKKIVVFQNGVISNMFAVHQIMCIFNFSSISHLHMWYVKYIDLELRTMSTDFWLSQVWPRKCWVKIYVLYRYRDRWLVFKDVSVRKFGSSVDLFTVYTLTCTFICRFASYLR